MTSPAAGARPDDDRRTGSTTPADGAPRRPRRRRGGRGRTRQNTSLQDTHGQAASGVPAADAAASPGGATPDSAAPGGAAVDPAGGAAPSIDADVPALRERIAALGRFDAHRLRRRLDAALRTRAVADRSRALATLVAALDTAEARLAARRAAVPRITYPAALPVTARRDDIAAAIRDHQVVIVAGETGSGKTTQIPKICLDLGRGVTGMIGHTQPRRLAARTVADRIAEELGTELGDVVGYKVRFTDQVGENTLVKLMTDGILLAELTGDRDLSRYDTLIIDEAHERSLNIDFILGYLTRLLPRRPDLKVVITSATIDTERFAAHFDAPVVEVSGRSYPVEVRYRPVVDPDDPEADPDRDEIEAIGDAVAELQREGPGDVLVFLPGEREIRDTADALAKRNFRNTEILPLYARLTTAEQHRVFAAHSGNRIVLATNVAETSLTVPGIRYVVDTGLARVSRYSRRLKVQRLPIEKVSQASANQRAGRCGRVADGICIRLYAEDDFDARPEFTDPEILRTNLASVILQMIALDLGDLAAFPFVDKPDLRAVGDGLALLNELGALEHGHRTLTAVGRALSTLPVDPRLGRMLVEADRTGCLREVLIITAALSIQDPRERPTEQRQAADARHARFDQDGSDFVAFLKLWEYVQEQRAALTGNRFRKLLREEFLHFLRIREWQDLHGQLRSAARNAGMTLNDVPADADRIHVAVLSGLLSQVGLREAETREFLGARGAKFMIFPGSPLAKKPPRWVMAAELVETSRLWARTVARIQPEWIEPLAGHLVKRTYSEPHWSRKRAGAVAVERVTLHGVPIVVGRNVDLGRIDPELARELFLRHALVEGDWDTRHAFFAANRALLDDVEELETRARRRDLVVDEDTLFAFYDARVPAEVVSGRHFDTWWKRERRRHPDLLDLTAEFLTTEAAKDLDTSAYPDAVEAGGLTLPLSYAFEPGQETDGITVDVPVAALHQVDPTPFTWQVPGLREDLVTALIKTLPKHLRRLFAPAPDHARAVLARLQAPDPWTPRTAARRAGARAGPDAQRGDPARRVGARPAARTPDRHVPGARRARPRGRPRHGPGEAAARAGAEGPRGAGDRRRGHRGDRADDLVDRHPENRTLPREIGVRRGPHVVTGYPGLVDRGTSVDVRVFPTAAERDPAHRRGVRRLLLLETPSPARAVTRGLDNAARLALSRTPHGSLDKLLDDCVTASVDALITAAGGPAWDEASYAKLRAVTRAKLESTTVRVLDSVRTVLTAWHRVQARIGELTAPVLADARRDAHRGR